MKRYIFREQKIPNEYQYVFLCGSKYVKNDTKDKRNILRKFLQENNSNVEDQFNFYPIILEEHFTFRKSKSKVLCYDDIYMKDLYNVEMVTSYLVDNIIIIHESISTGAETGLFLSEKLAVDKTCLLVPDRTAVEQDQIGQFIRLAFMQETNMVKQIYFYPRIERNLFSDDVKYWHTYFWEDRIGVYLGAQILDFLRDRTLEYRIEFTNKSKKEERVNDGYIHYQIQKQKKSLKITLLPRVLILCIASLFNIGELSSNIFDVDDKKLSEYINDITACLKEVFIDTVMEITGDIIASCSIETQTNIKGEYISSMVGMVLYLFQAAGFIVIKKANDYLESDHVKITRKMIRYRDGSTHFFYEKYKNCIGCPLETQIV